MNQYTTYTIKSRNSPNIWRFKYHLNGVLAEFSILEGMLTDKQIEWLSSKGHFPFFESEVKAWQDKLKDNFEIIVGEPDISFEALWNLYGHKVSKADAEKAFKKMKEADKITCFLAVPEYLKYIATKPHTEKLHLSTYINKRRYEDELPTTQSKPAFVPNHNPMIKDLAKQKTEK